MTNSSEKTTKASRDTLDLDLDARLDQATLTLPLDNEPPAGDTLDQTLARAKKEIDADLPEKLTPDEIPELDVSDIEIENEFDLDDLLIDDDEVENVKDFSVIKSEPMTSLENQLADIMDSSTVADNELDDLLGISGFDFDSLLGEAATDKLATEIPEMDEDLLMSAVDELLHLGVTEKELEAVVEPKIIAEDLVEDVVEPELEAVIEPEIIAEDLVEDVVEPELEAVIEPEIIVEDLVEDVVEPELEAVIEPEIIVEDLVEDVVEPELEAVIEPEIIAEDLVEDVVDPELEAVIEPEIIVEDLVEDVVEPEIIVEDLVEEVIKIEPEENELSFDVELTVEPEAALDDLVDSVPFEDLLKVDSEDAEIENFEEEFNNFDEVADSVAPLVEISTSDESFDDDLTMMQQLDGLNEAMENKNDTVAGFDLLDDNAIEKEGATTVSESADDDWMKQLDDLEEIAPSTSAELAEKIVTAADDDDWMKQLDDLDTAETESPAPVKLEKSETEEVADEDDWMKQLEGLDEDAEKPAESTEEVIADEDDWMKQLDGLDNHDEETSKMLMDAGHDHTADEVVDNSFNIANEAPQKKARAIDEESLIAKAADLAISQFKDEFKDDQEHIMSQLRADQDTIESRNRTQFVDVENKRKKTATFGYIALGVGVIGLLGSAGIGWLSYGTKDKTETLSQSVTTLEEKVDDLLAKSPEKEKEIANIKTSVEQLNQKVEKIAAAQVVVPVPAVAIAVDKTLPATTDAAKANSPVALLNNKVAPTSPAVEVHKVAEPSITPAIDIAPEHPAGEKAKDSEHEKSAEAAKKATETAKAEATKIAKAESELLSQKIAKATAVAKAASATTKTEEQRKLLTEKATRYTGRMTRGMARGGEKEQSDSKTKVATKTPAKNTSKEVLNAAIPTKKAVSAGKYSVNVVSYQQEWFAQSKAAEFRQKGIPVEVVPVDASNVGTRYRLKVAGFKNKAEAGAYAEKIKKSHNVGESWVGEN